MKRFAIAVALVLTGCASRFDLVKMQAESDKLYHRKPLWNDATIAYGKYIEAEARRCQTPDTVENKAKREQLKTAAKGYLAESKKGTVNFGADHCYLIEQEIKLPEVTRPGEDEEF
jgi:hypothetical protein